MLVVLTELAALLGPASLGCSSVISAIWGEQYKLRKPWMPPVEDKKEIQERLFVTTKEEYIEIDRFDRRLSKLSTVSTTLGITSEFDRPRKDILSFILTDKAFNV